MSKKKVAKKKVIKKAAPKAAPKTTAKPQKVKSDELLVLQKILYCIEILVEEALQSKITNADLEPAKPATGATPEEKPQPKAKKRKKVKKEDVREALMNVRDKTQDDKYKDVMAEFLKEGSKKDLCRKVSEIREDDYEAIVKVCETILTSLASEPEPEAPSSGDDIFDD